MTEPQTIPAKYIFLDVVSFTHNRSVEAQTDIVHALNAIVSESIAEFEVEMEKVIFLPTGDGICITLLNIESPYDIHIQIALLILRKIYEHNKSAENEMRKFEVRIGINSNTDNLVTDINRKQNIAGNGINMAARVMSKADESQILIGRTVYDNLCSRERYMNDFRRFNAKVKHGLQIEVYQYICTDCLGLNIETPNEFQTKQLEEIKLSRRAAYYFAHSIKNNKFLTQNIDDQDVSTILLWFLAKESTSIFDSTELNPHISTIHGKGKLSIEEVFDYYEKQDAWIKHEFVNLISKQLLPDYRIYVKDTLRGYPTFINDKGKEKLKNEFPDIWDELELDLIEEI